MGRFAPRGAVPGSLTTRGRELVAPLRSVEQAVNSSFARHTRIYIAQFGSRIAKIMTVDLEDEDFRTLADFRHQLRIFLSFSKKAAKDVGLTPQQHQALLAIRGFGPSGIGVGELATRLLLRPHSASEIVDRLQKAGLVGRTNSSQDRREVRVVLTGEAEKRLAHLSQIHRDELRRIGPLLKQLLSAV